MEIRVLTPDDAALFRTLRLAGLKNDPEAFGSDYEEERERPLEVFADRIGTDASGRFAIGAFEGGAMVGVLGFFREMRVKSKHKGWIWGVYVDGAHRKKGIGRALFDAALAQIRTLEGVTQVTLDVGTYNTAARGLYLAAGFVPCGIEPRALKVGDRYIDEERMVLLIDP